MLGVAVGFGVGGTGVGVDREARAGGVVAAGSGVEVGGSGVTVGGSGVAVGAFGEANGGTTVPFAEVDGAATVASSVARDPHATAPSAIAKSNSTIQIL